MTPTPVGPDRQFELLPLAGVLATFFAAIVLLFAANLAFVFGAGLVMAHGHSEQIRYIGFEFARSDIGVVCGGLVSSATLGLTALASARMQGTHVTARMRLGPSRASVLGLACAVVGTVGLALSLGSVAELLGVARGSSMHDIARTLSRASLRHVAAALVTLAILPSLAEEALFRGLLQGMLVARLGRAAAIVASASLFGAVHVDPVQGLLAACVGIYLGWTAERFGGIRPGMVAHAVNNGVFIMTSVTAGLELAWRRDQFVLAAAGAGAWLFAMFVQRSPAAVTNPR